LLFYKNLGFFLKICINQRKILLTGYIPEVLCFVSGLSGSRYKMEYTIDKCSELDQNIDLSSLNLTALYNCHYLSCVHTVDLSSNNLSSCSLPQLHPLQRCQVGGSMLPEAPCSFNLSVRWSCVVRFMYCMYLWETLPVAIWWDGRETLVIQPKASPYSCSTWVLCYWMKLYKCRDNLSSETVTGSSCTMEWKE